MNKVIKHSILFLILITSLLLNLNINIKTYESRDNKNILVNVNINNEIKQVELKYESTYKDLLEYLSIDDLNSSSLYSLDLKLYNNQNIEIRNDNNYISLNAASFDQLITLPGIGEKTALKIIEYRELNNGFKYLEELKNVSGIGDKKYEKIKELISL